MRRLERALLDSPQNVGSRSRFPEMAQHGAPISEVVSPFDADRPETKQWGSRMIATKMIKTVGIAAALLFGVAMASEASAGSRGARHGGGYSGARVVKHGHAIGHRHAGYRARGVRAGLYAAAGFGVGYAAASGAYAGYGVTYAQPEATYAAAPVYAAPEPRSYVRSYQVPVTVNRVVTRQYQQPVTSYQTEYRTEYVPVRRAYQRPVTVMQTYQRSEVVPTTEYRTVQKRCNCSWDY